VLDRPNNSILAAARESSEQAGAEISYALTPRTVIGASAAFYEVNYKSVLDAQTLASAKSSGTHVFSSYHLTRHNWIGLDYTVQDLNAQQPQSRSLVRGVLYTQTLLLRSNMSVSFFAGPQYSLTRGNPGLPFAWASSPLSAQANWSWAGGANYVWSGDRTNLTVGLSRRITDGAGLQGIVQLSSATAEVHRDLTRRLKGQLLVSDTRNKALMFGLGSLSYASVTGGLTRMLNPRLSLDLQYSRIYAGDSGIQANSYLANHHRISLSLTYNFEAPFQR
jgi:hypothetical protein